VWGLVVVILLPFPISGCHGLDYHDPFCSGPHRVFRLLRPLSPLLELKLIIYHHYWINCHDAKLRPITFSVGRIPVRKAGSNCSLTIIILVLVLSVIGGVLILRLHKVYDKEIDSMYGRWQNCLIGCSLFLSIVLVIRV
jgi:hypothetical protein